MNMINRIVDYLYLAFQENVKKEEELEKVTGPF